VPRALDLRHRQEGRDPPRRVRRQSARPRRRSVRPGQALTLVGRNTLVSLKVELHDAQNAPLAAPEEISYLHGGYGQLFAKLEHSLEGRQPGDAVQVQLEPEDAFGEYDAELLRVEPASRYGEGVAVGMEVEEDQTLYRVTDVAGGSVVLDANHPLAGMALRFSVVILSVRAATQEEQSRAVSSPLGSAR
jgi:FKBP-type peptidyl-prolyl cis-trans isomerase SlyD